MTYNREALEQLTLRIFTGHYRSQNRFGLLELLQRFANVDYSQLRADVARSGQWRTRLEG